MFGFIMGFVFEVAILSGILSFACIVLVIGGAVLGTLEGLVAFLYGLYGLYCLLPTTIITSLISAISPNRTKRTVALVNIALQVIIVVCMVFAIVMNAFY